MSASGAVRGPRGEDAELPVDDGTEEIAESGEGRQLIDTEADGTHLRVLTQGIPGAGAVQIARPLDETDSQLHDLLIALIALGVVGIALGVALGALVARAALVPIARFTNRTEELAGDLDPSQRMEVVGDDELARLARSFNTTLDALERSVEAQRHLVADASHELRTPIASLRANIQTMQDEDRLPPDERERMREDIVGELDELTALVADVVELARGTKTGEATDDVRLDQVVEELVARARRRAGGDDHVPGGAGAHAGEGRARADLPRRLEPARKRGEVEPTGSGRRGGALGRGAHRARPRSRLRRAGPAPRVRALLPRGRRPRDVRLRARPRDRAAGRRGPWWLRGGVERARGRRAAAGELRAGRRGGG